MNDTPQDVREFLKGLSTHDFLHIGMNEIAYMRPVEKRGDDNMFAVYAADGTKLGIMDTKAKALEAMRNNDLMLVTLQ